VLVSTRAPFEFQFDEGKTMRILLFGCFSAILTLASPEILQAQNLIVNPDFDVDLGAWTASAGAIAAFDSTHNVVGQIGSGSALVTNDQGPGSAVDISQCVPGPFVPGTYDFGAWVLMDPVPPLTGSARVSMTFYASSDCSGSVLDYRFVDSSGLNAWTLETIPIVMSGGSVGSVRVRLETRLFTGGSGPLTAYFDGVRFGLMPTVPVELQSFDVD